MKNDEKVELKIDAQCFIPLKLHNSDRGIQSVVFAYDKFIKGEKVAMILPDGIINSPNVEIYFSINQLKSIMQFLIESEV